ncbi:MAG: Fe-S cluster assembly protein SufD [Bacteroidales bacterium]|jgi:Fe-S cluster assembly protein SufD|nr:Fe-S cluster assembly protein SufD [Bacteroidales bacterium]
METTVQQSITLERMVHLFESNRQVLASNDTALLSEIRDKAFILFGKLGFPDTKMEAWRHTDLKDSLERGYDYYLHPLPEEDVQKVFRCNIPHLDTAIIGQLNGWYVSKEVPLMELGNGIIMGSLAEAKKKYPALVDKYYSRATGDTAEVFTAMNTAFAQDGIFIYVPAGVKSTKPVQLINVIHHYENLFLQSRNLIVIGDNASLSLVHCDDSYNQQASFSNIVTEIFLGENAFLDHYKLQNLNNNSTLISTVYFQLEAAANLESHYLSLNGGLLRNNIRVLFNGTHGNADIYGLYLMDRRQHIDNHVFVDHASPDCTSNEIFKGILDENAHGVFNGHVLVRRNSTGTDARQTNKNILLTDTARVNSKPFLEIYNDDVKCSHGSTTGQLDSEALFYLRQRGIGEESARMLLMFAFANEIVGKIAIPQLRQRIEDMVKKRLQGELQICEQCVLHCSTPEQPVEFKIDMSKI